MTTRDEMVELPAYEDSLDQYFERLRLSTMSDERKRKCAMLFAEAVDAMCSLSAADRTIAIFGSVLMAM